MQAEYLHLTHQAPQRVAGGVGATMGVQASDHQREILQQSTAVAIRIAMQALPDDIHLLAIDFTRKTRLQGVVALGSYGCQQFWRDAYCLGRLRQVVAQASDIMLIDLQDGLVQRYQRLQSHVGGDVRVPVTITSNP